MIDGQTVLNIREVNSYQSEEIRSLKDRVRLLETQEFPFVRHRDFDAKGDLIVGSADNTYDNLAVGVTNGLVLQVDNTQALGIKWATIPTAGITDASVTNAKLDNMAQATVKGRAVAAGTGVPVDLTAAQLNAIVASASIPASLTISASDVDGILASVTNTQSGAALSLFATGTTAYGITEWIDSGVIETAAAAAGGMVLSAFAGDITFQTSSRTNRLHIGSNGRVAIGNNAPSLDFELEKSSVDGVVQSIINSQSGAALSLFATGTTGYSIGGWPDAGVIESGANASAGLILGAYAGSFKVQTGARNTRFTIDSSGNIVATGTLQVGAVSATKDADTANYIARAAIGGNGFTDYASFAHLDNNNTTAYALLQYNDGSTYLNAKTGTPISLRIANSDVAVVSAGLLAVTGDITVSDDLTVTDLTTTNTLGVGISSVGTGKAHIYKASSTASPASIAILTIENDDAMALQLLNGGNEQAIYFGDNIDNDAGRLRYWHSEDDWELVAGGTTRIRYDSSENSWRPTTDVGQSLGTSTHRWNEVWAFDGSINTSDEREKRNVKPSDLGLDFIMRLQPISWIWQDRPAYEIDETDDGQPIKQIVPEKKYKRPHYGLSAQQVRRALDDSGVEDFAGYIHDADADVYALRYNEFIAPLIVAVQELAEQIKELQNGHGKTH